MENGALDVSLVIPWCLRITEKLPGVRAIVNDLRQIGCAFEVVVVGVEPRAPLPPTLARILAGVTVTTVPTNPLRGATFFLEEAAGTCRGAWVLVTDPNLAYRPGQARALWDRRADRDAVVASKFHPESQHDYPAIRRSLLAWYRQGLAWLFGTRIEEPQPAAKLYRTTLLAEILQRALFKPYVFDLELFVIAQRRGARIATAPLLLHHAPLYLPWQPLNVVRITMDTLSVWYRACVQRYYDRPQPAPPAQVPMVSIVIPCVAPTPRLMECLQACQRLAYSAYEILVLPDAPCDIPDPGVTVIPTGAVPPGAKRDVGVERARGELIAFLDDDAAPARGWLSRAVGHFADDRVGGVGGPAITPANDGLRQVCSGAVYSSVLVTGTKQYRYIPAPARDVEELPTSNLIVRKRDFLRAGGFDTHFWPGEDTVLCMKLTRQLGQRIVYDPDVLVFHHRRPLFGPHLRQVLRYAEHRGYFVRRFQMLGFRVSYCVPSLFLLALASSGLVIGRWPTLGLVYLGGLVGYLAVTLTYGLRAGNLRMTGYVLAGTLATHVVYGFYFLKGLITPRLADARRVG